MIKNREIRIFSSDKNVKMKKKNTKMQSKDPFSHISPSLLPQAALASVVPKSSKHIRLSRSPSPLTRAIASISKIGQSIVGDTFPIQRNTVEKDKEKQSSVERGRPSLRHNNMAGRPRIPVPVVPYIPDEEGLYAVVHKNHKQDPLNYDESEYEDITSVSEMEDVIGTQYDLQPSNMTQDAGVQQTLNEDGKFSGLNQHESSTAINHTSGKQNIQTNNFSEDVPSKEYWQNDITSKDDVCCSSSESKVRSDSQVITIRARTPNQSQLVYQSTESLEKDYLANGLASSSEELIINHAKSHQPLQNSMNSTISASNFITPEKILERVNIRSKSVSMDVDVKQKSILKEPAKRKSSEQEYLVVRDTSTANLNHPLTTSTPSHHHRQLFPSDTLTQQQFTNQLQQMMLNTFSSVIEQQKANKTSKEITFQKEKNDPKSSLDLRYPDVDTTFNLQNEEEQYGLLKTHQQAEEQRHLLKQNKHLQEQVRALRVIIRRLNEEVSRSKTTETLEAQEKQMDFQYVTGLVESFEQQILEKQETIEALKKSYKKLEKTQVPEEDWMRLKQQANVVLEENECLMEQKIVWKKALSESNVNHQREVEALNTQLLESNKKHCLLEQQLFVVKEELEVMKCRHKQLNESQYTMVEATIHEREVKELERRHREETTILTSRIDDSKAKLKASQKERENLVVQVSDLTAEILRLDMELQLTEKHSIKCEDQLAQCMLELDESLRHEVTTKETLSEVVKVAENSVKERDRLAAILSENMNVEEDHIKVEEMEAYMNEFKAASEEKLNLANEKISEQEAELNNIRARYENDLNSLRDIVRYKQSFIDRMQHENCCVDDQYNEIMRSIGVT